MISLSPAHLKKVKKVLSGNVPEYGVLVYGARASAGAGSRAYLDLAVLAEEPLPAARLEKLAADFKASALPFRVETVDWAVTGSSFRREIRKTGVPIQAPRGK